MKKDLCFESITEIQKMLGDKIENDIYKEYRVDVWRCLIEQNDGEGFIISHINLHTNNISSFYNNRFIKLGGKIYDVLNYAIPGSDRSFLIYDFKKRYLAPINVKITKEDSWFITADRLCNININVSVL